MGKNGIIQCNPLNSALRSVRCLLPSLAKGVWSVLEKYICQWKSFAAQSLYSLSDETSKTIWLSNEYLKDVYMSSQPIL